MTLSRYGDRRSVPEGTVLFCEGDRDCGFFVVLEGKVAVVQETAAGAAADRRPRPRPVPGGPVAADRTGGSRDRRGRRPTPRFSRFAWSGSRISWPPTRRWETSSCGPSSCAARSRPTSGPACGSSGRSTTRTPGGSGTSRAATGSPTSGSTWRRIPRPRTCCVPWASRSPRHLSSSGRASGSCATRATPSWPTSSGCERRRPGRRTTSSWWAQARAVWPQRSTPRPRGSRRSSWTRSPPAARRPRPPRSRTTWGSPPASPAASWPTAPWSRPASSAPSSTSPARRPPSHRPTATTWWG